MKKSRILLIWTITVVLTLSSMIYQRTTGPTYPKKVDIEIDGDIYKLKLLRSNEIGTPCDINIPLIKNITAKLVYKRYKTNEEWTEIEMKIKTVNKKGEEVKVLNATLPEQPAAGKIEYYIDINNGYKLIQIAAAEPVVLRFKGFVPRIVLIPHVLLMIFALFFAMRAGIEALFKGKKTLRFAMITLVVLGVGGLVLGPIVQKYAFGEYWTGWPFGSDWTDNKTLIAFIFWVIAYFVLRKKPQNRLWPIIATLVFFAIYMIPHSMGGSELNAETGKIETGLNK